MSIKTTIEWVKIQNRVCLRFRFVDHLYASEAHRAIEEWKRMYARKPDQQIVLVWDCLDMTNYDSEARKLWAKALQEMKHQTSEIWVISNSSLVKMGAGIMAMTSQIKTKVVNSEELLFKP